MTDYVLEVLPTLTILAIGLVFGFMIGMLFYYPEIQGLRTKLRSYATSIKGLLSTDKK